MKLLYGILIALVIIAILALIYWHYKDIVYVINVHDGESIYVQRPPTGTIKVTHADYVIGCKIMDVKDKITTAIMNSPSNTCTFDAVSMGLLAGGSFSFSYKCGKSDSKHHQSNMTSGLNGGNLMQYQDFEDVKFQSGGKEGFTQAPFKKDVVEFIDDFKKDFRKDMANRYEDSWLTENMDKHLEDNATEMLTSIVRRATNEEMFAPGCLHAPSGYDTDFVTDYQCDGVILDVNMNSDINTPGNPITGVRYGLGSKRIDPRFQPGHHSCEHRDYSSAQGTHAGGSSLGGFIPSTFQTSGSWHSTPIGFTNSAGGWIQQMVTPEAFIDIAV
jgi:hypothetical protein